MAFISETTRDWFEVYAHTGITAGKQLSLQNQSDRTIEVLETTTAGKPSALERGYRLAPGADRYTSGSKYLWVRARSSGLQLFVQEIVL